MKKNLWKLAAVCACAMVFTACGDDGDDTKCSFMSPCKADQVCNDSAKCVAKTATFECSKNTVCADDKECKVNVCKPIACSATVKCPADKNLICNDTDVCIKATDKFNCGKNAPCQDNQKCEKNLCVDNACSKTIACKGDFVCNNDSICIPKNSLFQCGKNLDCADDSLKCSAKNLCVECLSETDCNGKNCSVAGVCIECLDSTECKDNTDGRTVCGANSKCVSDGVFAECKDCSGAGKLCIGGVHCVDTVKDGDACDVKTFVNRCADGAVSRASIICENSKVVTKKCKNDAEATMYCFVSVEGSAECVEECKAPLKAGDVEFVACGTTAADKNVLAVYTCAVPYKNAGALVSFEKLTDCAVASKVCGGNPASCIAK